MMRSMFAGVSGLKAHQTMMDVVGNNVANVNTTGFKSSRVLFADALSQMLRGTTGAGTGQASGGVSPMQVGLGATVTSIDKTFSQGNTQLTGNATDVAVEGEGLFAVRQGTEVMYTRAGAFHFDLGGNLVDPSGAVVQGWLADATGVVSSNGPIGDLKVPSGQTIEPTATTSVSIRGNMSSATTVGASPIVTAMDVYDAVGAVHRMSFSFTKTGTNQWSMATLDPTGASLGTTAITFDPASGKMLTPATPPAFTYAPSGATAMTFTVDFGTGTTAATTQYGSGSDVQATTQDGSAAGAMRSFGIGADGTLSGVFSNGKAKVLGQLAVTTFADNKSLIASGENHFRMSTGSGVPLHGVAGVGGRGLLVAGNLEMSNVDLAAEFSNLILAQRGFQANSRIITTTDEMVQDLVNIKR